MVGGEKEIEGLRNDRSVGGAETNIDNKGVIFIFLISTDRRPGKLVLIPPSVVRLTAKFLSYSACCPVGYYTIKTAKHRKSRLNVMRPS